MDKKARRTAYEIILELLEKQLRPYIKNYQFLSVGFAEPLERDPFNRDAAETVASALLRALRAMAVSRRAQSKILSKLGDLQRRIMFDSSSLSDHFKGELTRSIRTISARSGIASTTHLNKSA